MKKVLFTIFIFLIPIFVNADYSVKDYRIDITVLENGDLNIIESFTMDGIYNGYEKNIIYKDNYKGYHGSKVSSIEDTFLYDADSITLNEIRSIDYDSNNDILNLIETSYLFSKEDDALKGDYGVYTINKIQNGYLYKIYNPSKMNKDFYIDYTLNNLVIVHEDVAEIGLNLFNKLNENIEKLTININIPDNETILNFWVHNLNEFDYEIIDKQTIKLIANNINNKFDFRLVFDKKVITDINKKSKENVYDKILEIETNLLNDSNDKNIEKIKENIYNLVTKAENSLDKEDYNIALKTIKELKDDNFKTELLVRLMNLEPKVERKIILTKVINSSLMGIFILSILITVYQIYKRRTSFKFYKTYNKIPSKCTLTNLAYLIKRKIDKRDLCASIINLIIKDNITLTLTKNKKDCKLIKIKEPINNCDQRLIKFIFDDKEEITLTKFKKKVQSDKEFIVKYSNWIDVSMNEAISEKFYEDLFIIKIFGIILSIVGIVISALLLDKQTYFSPLITIFICLLSLIYFIFVYKRTVSGYKKYKKCMGFKRYLTNTNDISNELCNEYFSYSIVLGIVDKFYKNNSSKLEDLYNSYKIINETINYVVDNIKYLKK